MSTVRRPIAGWQRLIWVALGGLVAWAADAAPAQAGAPSWVHAAQSPPPAVIGAQSAAVVLWQRTEMKVGTDLRVQVRIRRVLRILRSPGLESAQHLFFLTPHARLLELSAWTLHPDGTSAGASRESATETTLAPGSYDDTRRILLAAPQAQVGDIVAFECAYADSLAFPSYHWWPQEDDLAVGRAEFAVELPSEWTATAHASGGELREGRSGRRLREFALGPLAELPEEPASPPPPTLVPQVIVRFHDPAGQRSFADWASVATWYARLCAPKMAPDPELAEALARGRGADPRASVAGLAREVQHSVHYVAIELGKLRWEPDAAKDTWQRRYGDCKDKAILLATILQARGLEARPALTRTRDWGEVDPSAPDPGQFNHCIVAVAWPDSSPPPAATVAGPSGRLWTFFDPTSTSVVLGLLPPMVAGAYAVIADPAEGLVRLPEPLASVFRAESEVRLGEDGAATGTFAITAEGVGSARLVAAFEDVDAQQRRERAAAILRAPGVTPEIRAVRWAGVDSTRLAASLEVEARLSGAVRRTLGGWIVQPIFPLRDEGPVARDSTRLLPVSLGGPARYEHVMRIRLPDGVRPEITPAIEWSGAIGAYELRQQAIPGWLILTRRLELRQETVPARRYAEVLQFWRACYRGDTEAILLRSGGQ